MIHLSFKPLSFPSSFTLPAFSYLFKSSGESVFSFLQFFQTLHVCSRLPSLLPSIFFLCPWEWPLFLQVSVWGYFGMPSLIFSLRCFLFIFVSLELCYFISAFTCLLLLEGTDHTCLSWYIYKWYSVILKLNYNC